MSAVYRHIREVMRYAAAAAPIPPLRPPHEAIVPSVWERYGWAVALAAVVVGAGLLSWARLKRSGPALPSTDPLAIARGKLASLDVGEDGGDWPDLVSQILRWGLLEHFQLPWLEYTTEELEAMLEEKRCLPEDVFEEWKRVLGECDRARFATGQTGLGGQLKGRAIELLERIARLPVTAAKASEPARKS